MLNPKTMMGIAVLAMLVTGCDSDQPLQIEEQTVSISFSAVNAVPVTIPSGTYNVWDMIEDNDMDGAPDDGETYLWCEFIPSNSTVGLSPSTVPWTYSIRVSIIRAGETTPEQLCAEFPDPDAMPGERPPLTDVPCDDDTDCFEQGLATCEFTTRTTALDSVNNVADYDTTSITLGVTPDKDPVDEGRCSLLNSPCTMDSECNSIIGEVCVARHFVFDNPRRHPSSHFDVMMATTNPLAGLQGQTTVGAGLCSTDNPGPTMIDGEPAPLELIVGKGDTVIVEALQSDTAPPGLVLGNVPLLASQVELEGRSVNVNGTTSGSSISYSFTTR